MENYKNFDFSAPITSEMVQDLMKIEGKTRGATLKTDAEYILKKGGQGYLRKIEEAFERFNFPFKYGEVNPMAFYPIGLRILSLLIIKEALDLKKDKIREIGEVASKTSLIMKFFMQYFLSLKKTFSLAPQIWKKYYSVGDLRPIELNEEKRFMILRLENFNVHPILCSYLEGFLTTLLKMIVKSPNCHCEEEKCFFRGGENHEYLFKW